MDCKKLDNVTIPENITSIGNNAFCGCTGLKTLNFNAVNCTYIGDGGAPTFISCPNFQTVNFGNRVTNIPDNAFKSCTGLKNINLPESLTNIGAHAFDHCSSLDNVTIPSQITVLNGYTFYYCTSLSNLTLNNSLTTIGDYSLSNCTNLKTLYVPDSVQTIGSNPFSSDKNLTIICYSGTPIASYVDRRISHKYVDNIGDADIIFNVATCTYNGKQRNPSVTVKNALGEKLTKGVDYTLEIPEGRTDAGTYVYTVTGIGAYSGTASKNFVIKPMAISAALNKNRLAYTGKQRNPVVIVKDANKNRLTREGIDYIVEYPEGRTDSGEYLYIIRGTGNYTGTVRRTLTIGDKFGAKLNADRLKYNGKVRNPKLIVSSTHNNTIDPITLTEGVDYTVDIPEGRKDPGEYEYVIHGKGAYFGEVRLTLTIYSE